MVETKDFLLPIVENGKILGEMWINLSIQCGTCLNYLENLKCKAFEQIPQQIREGSFDHTQPWPDADHPEDNGLRYKPIPGLKNYHVFRNPNPCHQPAGSPEGGQFTACPWGPRRETSKEEEKRLRDAKKAKSREEGSFTDITPETVTQSNFKSWNGIRQMYALDALAEISRHPETYFGFILKERNSIKGIACFGRFYSIDPHNLYLSLLATKETGHGYGRKMMQEICRRAAEQGKGIYLDATSSAEEFYRRLGMHEHTDRKEAGVFSFTRDEAEKFANREFEEKAKEKLKAAGREYTADEIDAAEPEDGIFTKPHPGQG